MSESDAAADRMVEVLSRAWPFASEGVVNLLSERWIPYPKNDYRVWTVLQSAPSWNARALEAACAVAGRADISLQFIDHAVAMIGVDQPDAALRLTRARLDHDLSDARAKASELAKNPKPYDSSLSTQVTWLLNGSPERPLKHLVEYNQGWDSIPALAEQAPAAFLEILWPWYVQCFQAIKSLKATTDSVISYPLPYLGDFRFGEEIDDGLP